MFVILNITRYLRCMKIREYTPVLKKSLMNTLVVSLSFAQRADEVIADSALRFQLAPTSSTTWAFDPEVEDIIDSISETLEEYGIPSDEYEFRTL